MRSKEFVVKPYTDNVVGVAMVHNIASDTGAAGRNVGVAAAQIHEKVLDLRGPIVSKCVLDSAADRPARSRCRVVRGYNGGSAERSERIGRLDAAKCNATCG